MSIISREVSLRTNDAGPIRSEGSLTALPDRLIQIGAHPDDSEDIRLQKRLLVAASILVVLAAACWGITFVVFHEPLAGAISLFYSVITLASLLVFRNTFDHRFFTFSQLLLGLMLPFFQMVALGGFMNSGAVFLWSMISAMGALFFYDFKHAFRWWLAYFTLLLLSGFMQPYVRTQNHLPAAVVTFFFVMNIGGVSTIVLLMLNYFIRQKDEAYRLLHIEQEKAENLLLNILPKEIAAILKNDQHTIADHFDGASILFADLVGFTPLTASLSPVQLVTLLNEIFSAFDALVEKYDVEKIRTIGDNYMVAAGVPRSRPDHARVLACLALEMIEYLHSRPATGGRRIEFRIGINSGPVIGGVIGRKKFVYDIWGDAVNIASRMESQGEAGRIQVTRETYDLIHPDFNLEPRGMVTVKGRGEMQTWFLLGMKPEAGGGPGE